MQHYMKDAGDWRSFRCRCLIDNDIDASVKKGITIT